MAEKTTEVVALHEEEGDHHARIDDDFFDTAQSASRSNTNRYSLESERFIFEGEDGDFIVSPSLPHPHSGLTTESLLPGYHIRGGLQLDHDVWSEDHPLALPSFARLQQQNTHSELSGINYLNIFSFLIYATVSILLGSSLVDWLPSSPWTITTLPPYETLLTPARWAGDYLWIPVLSLEGFFAMAQLLSSHRSRPEVVQGVGHDWFYLASAQSLTTIFFCLRWIIPAWIALAVNSLCLLRLHLRLKQHHPDTSDYGRWKYWIFRFPFDVHLGWLLPLLASRASMLFRHYGSHDVGLQLGADIVAMALLLPCAGIYLVKGRGPPDWVVPLLILWAYIGIAWRLVHTPETLIQLYGHDIVAAVRGAAWCFAGTVSLMVLPKIVIWVFREFLTIHVVQLTDDNECENESEYFLFNDPRDPAMMTQF